jgi:hypothetical protein
VQSAKVRQKKKKEKEKMLKGASQNVATSRFRFGGFVRWEGEAISSLRREIACPTMSFRRALWLACPA